MEAGERNRLITMTPVTQTQDADGYPTETPGQALKFWASKEDVGGRERAAASQESAPYSTRWELSYAAAIDPDLVTVPKRFTLAYQGREYDIVYASMIGQKEGVELLTLAKQG